MVDAIESGYMPPWPPGPLSAPLRGRREVLPAELEVLKQWLSHPIEGSTEEFRPALIAPKVGLPATADAELMMSAPYVPPADPVTDEIRCFLLPEIPPTWIYGYEWVLGTERATHHILAYVTADVAKAQALDGQDGRPGWSCVGNVGVGAIGNLSNSSVGPDGGFAYPDGYGVEVPQGSRLVLSVHYLPRAVHGSDRSGVRLWLKASALPVTYFLKQAPSEVPSPLGVSQDPTSPLSRAYALAHTAPGQQQENDRILNDCGVSLASYYDALQFVSEMPEHWLAQGSCTGPLPSGRLISAHVHAHTRAATARIEVKAPSGDWQIVLDIPKWRWVWESSYVVDPPVPVPAGSQMRVSCSYDNGAANQWSAATSEPGHDVPALPPLQQPSYHLAGPFRNDEMCNGSVEVIQ